jgi:hypothetical protein
MTLCFVEGVDCQESSQLFLTEIRILSDLVLLGQSTQLPPGEDVLKVGSQLINGESHRHCGVSKTLIE